MKSVTDIGRELFNQACEFKVVMGKDKAQLKLSVCGHQYFVDIDSAAVKNDAAINNTWLNIFKEFELDLDKGVDERKQRIITVDSCLQI